MQLPDTSYTSYKITWHWIPVIIWMALIFYLSHQTGNQSSQLSTGITAIIVQLIEKLLPQAPTHLELSSLQYFVRKNAHFFLYFILGGLVANALRASGVKGYRLMGYALLICVVYAISDEVHQLFIPGRAGQIKDVLIDSAGAIGGTLLYHMALGRGKRPRVSSGTR